MYSKDHPLAKAIGLPTIADRSETSIHSRQRTLVFAKKGEKNDLYTLICGKVAAKYGAKGFREGRELKEAPKSDLIDGKYSQNLKRVYRTESRDSRSTIWVMDYEHYVIVLLVDAGL